MDTLSGTHTSQFLFPSVLQLNFLKKYFFGHCARFWLLGGIIFLTCNDSHSLFFCFVLPLLCTQNQNSFRVVKKIVLHLLTLVVAVYAFFIPYLHHFHETWKGYLFHALVSAIAFLALVITSEDVSQCFFSISHVAVNLFIPAATWIIIAILTLILHKTGNKEKYIEKLEV